MRTPSYSQFDSQPGRQRDRLSHAKLNYINRYHSQSRADPVGFAGYERRVSEEYSVP